MSIYGVLCGFTDFVNVTDFLELNEEYFQNLLNLENGIPSHDTFSRFFSIINPNTFMNMFVSWIKEIVGQKGLHIAIDGKAIKSARDKINKGNTPYILSGFLCDIGLSIEQLKVDNKSNEITVIPDLLDLIDIKGKIITIDAIGSQEEIVNKIVYEKKSSYMLKVKGNQKELKDDIKTYFDLGIKREETDIAIYETNYEKNHGRIEKRTYYLSYDVDCISNKEKWKSIIQVTREHWNIECSLHWRLDEDHSTSKNDNSIDNLAIIRKIVFNLARLDTSMGNLTLKKKMNTLFIKFS